MTEVVPAISTEVLNPITGELVDCTDLATAGVFLRQLRDMKLQLDDVIKHVEAVALTEMSQMGQGTVRAGGVELVRQGGPTKEYDIEVLQELLDVGLPPARYEEAVKRTVTEKADAAVLKQLAAANPVYAEVIERATRVVEKRAWIKTKFSRGEAA